MPQDKKKQYQKSVDVLGEDLFGTSPTPAPGARRPDVDVLGEDLFPQVEGALTPYIKAVAPVVAPVADFLSRPQYASAAFFDALADDSKGVLEALSDAGSELVSPKRRLSFRRVIQDRAPEFAKANPEATAALGFIGDVALDPTSYIGVGVTGKGLKIGGGTLNKAGREALEVAAKSFERPVAKLVRNDRAIFNAVAERAGQIERVYESVGLGTPETRKAIAEKAARLEVVRDLARVEQEGAGSLGRGAREIGTITAPEVEERSFQRLRALVEGSPEVAKEITEKEKLALKLYPKSNLLPTTEIDIPLFGLDGLKTQMSRLKATRPAQVVGRLFSRDFELPAEYVELRGQLAGELDAIERGVLANVKKLASDLTPEGRQRVSTALNKVETTLAEAGELFVEGADPNFAVKVTQDAFKDLKPNELAHVMKLITWYDRAKDLEWRAGLLERQIENFDPTVYDAVMKGPEFARLRKWELRKEQGMGAVVSPETPTMWDKLDELKASVLGGADPESDALLLYAQRLAASRAKVAVKHFEDGVSAIWGPKFNNLPQRLKDDIQFIGDGNYPRQFGENTTALLRFTDRLAAPFRYGATVAKLSFAPKQLLGNTNQAVAEMGLKAFKAFDPRVALDAGIALIDRATGQRVLPQYIRDAAVKSFGPNNQTGAAWAYAMQNKLGLERAESLIDGTTIVSALGEKIPMREALRMAEQYGVVPGVNQAGDRLGLNLARELGAGKPGYPAVRHLKGFLSGLASLPGEAETYSRLQLFFNGLRMGYTPQRAAQVVNKTLFDYSQGLSAFERQFLRRFIPFYSYQRFALPLVFKKAAERAGTLTVPQKLYDAIGAAIGGEELTPEQRFVLGDSFLLEQPKAYVGVDENGKPTFKTLGSTSPLEVVDMIEYGRDGKIDWQKTVEKSLMAQLTPLIKVPLELVQDRQFFNDQAISTGGRIGNYAATYDQLLPQFAKDLIGWETVKNPKTGKVSTYINPYMAYTSLQYIPALKAFLLDPVNEDLDPADRTLKLLSGIGTYKADFEAMKRGQVYRDKKEVQDLKSKIRLLKKQGRTGAQAEAEDDYRELLEILRLQREARERQ